MDFDACSKCFYGQSGDLCDAHIIHEYYSENEVDEIFYRHGVGCHFYIDTNQEDTLVSGPISGY